MWSCRGAYKMRKYRVKEASFVESSFQALYQNSESK